MRYRHDVVIVGAGPGGSAAAHYLARHGLDVLLLDKAAFPRDKTCGDGLTPRALRVLDDMGILNDLLHIGCRMSGVTIVSPHGQAVTAALPKPGDRPDYALVVPRLLLDDMLCQRAQASGATFWSSVHVRQVEANASDVVVTGEHQGRAITVRGRIAILATGASPTLLLRMGLLEQTPQMLLAARAYVEGMASLTDQFHLSFERVPLPGYGWVFPLSSSSANLGAGVFSRRPVPYQTRVTPRAAFDAFLQAPSLQPLLAGAHHVSPVKGYPLRTDFAHAPTVGPRTLIVGEAAGLVNPLTGEGIDYALESGKVAAEHLAGIFAAGDLAETRLMTYDALLRARFQRLFIFCSRMRRLFVNRVVLNRMVAAAARDDALTTQLVNIVLGNQAPADGVSLKTIMRVLLALLASRDSAKVAPGAKS